MAIYTKRAYEGIALVLADAQKTAANSDEIVRIGNMQAKFADMFAADNPNFDRDKFFQFIDKTASAK